MELREPREIRGRFRHGIGLQTPMLKNGHCRECRGGKAGARIEARSPDIAPCQLVGAAMGAARFAGKAKDEAMPCIPWMRGC